MGNIFSTVKAAKVPQTAFNLSHEKKLTLDLGKLTPVLVQEVVPGDRFKIRSDVMVKLAPMVLPIMHRIDVYLHYFFVPNRILWSGWEGFITNEDDSHCPHFTAGADVFAKNSLGDYLGVPNFDMLTEHYDLNELPWRCYWKIWNDYYRDENLQTEKDLDSLSGADYYNLAYRAWQKDYFTSALPWAQKGDPVKVPLGGEVTWNLIDHSSGAVTDLPGSATGVSGKKTTSDGNRLFMTGEAGDNYLAVDETDLTINDLRTAERLQRWLERNARAGTRYVEHLLAHWGIFSKDQRLQRAEYIGGGVAPVMISDIYQTSVGTGYLGQPAGHGIAVGNEFIGNKFCDEHGFIMGIMSIVPKPAYFQGLHKMFSRSLVTDFYFPEFANLGEQEVLCKELYFSSPQTMKNEDTFGYQSRYAEYKYSQDLVHGEYRDTLKAFHLGREFDTVPSLNEDFVSMAIEAEALSGRIFSAGRDAHPFWTQIYHSILANRPMPFYGTPQF